MADDKGIEISTQQAFLGPLGFRMFGYPIKALDLGVEEAVIFSKSSSKPGFARIRAVELHGICKPLPYPVVLMVPGNGRPANGEPCSIPGEWIWDVFPTDRSIVVDVSAGSMEEILSDITTRGISGGIEIENIRSTSSQICATIHIWAEVKVFGRKVRIDERFTPCIPFQGCHTVFSAGIARVDLCFEAPNRICAKLCVGAFGLEKCWDKCVTIPLPVTPSSNPECGCHKPHAA